MADKVGSVLVIGGGIGGIQTSLDLVESGLKVYLLERTHSIGGVMAQLDKTFPTNDCAMCTISPKLVECGQNLNIEIITNAELGSVAGKAGNFEVEIVKHARYIDDAKCTGCGVCAKSCPIDAIDEYNYGLCERRATYIRYPQAVPRAFGIDKDKCIGCGLCESLCLRDAVIYGDKEQVKKINVGSIILSTGFESFDPALKQDYGYGEYPNVVSSFEFERILSASGPYKGHIFRASDAKMPEKIAWIQCVGSRDRGVERPFCSSVCCTYAVKQAIIAKEHIREGLDTTIFYMDMRTYGKGFEQYFNRAKNEHGVRFVCSRIHTVDPGSDGNLKLVFSDDDGQLREEEFDMLVLSVGFKPTKNVEEFANRLGIKLNEYGFCKTSTFSPIETSRAGVYVAGAAQEPKDIPATVMEASGAAACAEALLAEAKGSQIVKKEYPPEKDVSGLKPRIGVFVCKCGINIAGVVDVPAVTEYAATLPDVAYAEYNLYTCSQDTQVRIKEIIEEKQLNRVIVASCTPRTHEPLFQDTIRLAGLNKYLFEMANVRDQCSWVHASNPEAATEKAKELIRMAVGRAAFLEPLHTIPMSVIRRALVIGGGVAGMNASLSLANQGFEVELVEHEPELGGNIRHIHFTLEGDKPQEYLNSLIEQVQAHKLISVHLESQVKKVSGHVGHFESEVRSKKLEVRKIEHGVVIVATGGVESKPIEYLYGKDDRVITQRELEEHLANSQSTIRNPHSVVMIQCVGSRNEERPYCSRICCTQAVKNALKLKEQNPDTQIYILYRDMRTYGFREEYYYQARKAGVIFIRYDEQAKPVVSNNGRLKVEVKDPILGADVVLQPDMVVLSVAIDSHLENENLAPLLKVTLDASKFFLEAHMKLRPVDFGSDGMFLCGLAHSPKLIEESIAQAQAAAGRAATILNKERVEAGGVVSCVEEKKCVACLTCIRMCPYDVPFINKAGVAEIEAVKCHGCGICASECPAKAIQLLHYRDPQVVAKVDAMFG
ncbi:MAG: CoB--CoM heterodisulfide reductase iron-sulfur subunit A family protein [bacterium]|nr:CoB--CoM heterodisulfide reductase iron-sulfur subunit A family protein [bacterium]